MATAYESVERQEVYVPTVVLTLTKEEAQCLRSILGHTDSRLVGDSGLGGVFDALEPFTDTLPDSPVRLQSNPNYKEN